MQRWLRNKLGSRPWQAAGLWVAIVVALVLTLRVWQLLGAPVPASADAPAPRTTPAPQAWN